MLKCQNVEIPKIQSLSSNIYKSQNVCTKITKCQNVRKPKCQNIIANKRVKLQNVKKITIHKHQNNMFFNFQILICKNCKNVKII